MATNESNNSNIVCDDDTPKGSSLSRVQIENIGKSEAELFRTLNPMLANIIAHVQAGRVEEVGIILENAYTKEQLAVLSWDIVPLVCDRLTDEIYTNNPNVVHAAEVVLNYLVEVANVKELILSLLEQADSFKDDHKFKALLKPVQKCLLKLPSKRGHSLAISLETFYPHIQSVPFPEDMNLEGEERKLLDSVESVWRLNDVSIAMLDFVTPFVEELCYKTVDQNEKKKKAKELNELTFLMFKLLNYPMVKLDLGAPTKREDGNMAVKSESRVAVEKLMVLMSMLHGDYFKCITDILQKNKELEVTNKRKREKAKELGDDHELDDDFDVIEPVPDLGIACFAYLAFGEKLSPDNLPQIYRPQFVLQFCSQFVTYLMSQKDYLIILKGVALLKSNLNDIPPMGLTVSILDWKPMSDVIQCLLSVIVLCPAKDVRQEAVKCVPLMIEKLDLKGRNKFLFSLFHETKHPGVFGYAVGLLKEEINKSLSQVPPSEYFIGNHLEKMLRVVFKLQNGATTDLLENSDSIMASLNLLRFLLLRDCKEKNVSGIWDHISWIVKEYFEPIHTGLQMSRAHYKLELENVQKGEYKPPQEGSPEVALSVGGQSMPHMDKQQHLRVIHMALHTFDMMQSVLIRNEEIIQSQKKESQSL